MRQILQIEADDRDIEIRDISPLEILCVCGFSVFLQPGTRTRCHCGREFLMTIGLHIDVTEARKEKEHD